MTTPLIGIRLPAAIVAAGLLVIAFPPVGWTVAAWIATTALVWALRGASGRAGLAIGFVFGLAFFGILLHWIARFGLVAWIPLVILQSSFVAVFGGLAARSSRWGLPARTAAIPAWWAATELLRASVPFGGFAWGQLGTSQVDALVARTARVGGATLTGALIVAFAVLAVELIDRRARRARLAALAAAIVIAPALLPVGLAGEQVGTIDVAAVQGNVPRGRFSTLGQQGGRVGEEDLLIIENHIDVTERLLSEEQKPALIVWPENAFDRDPMRVPEQYARTTGLIAELGSSLIAGTILDGGNHFTNTNLLIDPTGAQVDRYHKVHLVPFGEYVPIPAARRWVPLLQSEIPIDGRPGRRPVVFDVGGARVGSVICFESTYGPLVRANVRNGAQLIVVTTNNASFGDSPAAAQHMQMSRLRAIENGRAVVHAAIAGISAMILPDGTIIDRSALFVPALLRARLPLTHGQTPYARYGGGIEMAFAVGASVFALAAFRRKKEEPSGPA